MLAAMGPRYLIDGYNLLHRLPGLARLVETDIEGARDRLVRMLAAFRARKRIRVTVVFDGRMSAGGPATDHTLGVEKVFAGPLSADERIVQMIRRSRQPRAWVVVSSDRWVKENASDHGARTISSERFAELVTAAPTPSTMSVDGKPEMSQQDVAQWEEYFRSGGRDPDR